MMVLFTDFDTSEVDCLIEVDEEAVEDNNLEPEKIEDDGKRDEYLNKYQGIVFSTENLSFATTIMIDITKDTRSFNMENSIFKNYFLMLSSLNSAKLFQIRNKKL